MTSFSITVQWGAVECIHHNGDITGYLVQHRAQGNENVTMSVSGTKATVSNLMSSTTYSIEVAAVNSAGTGVFSPVIMSMTQTSKCYKAHAYRSAHMHTQSLYRGFIVAIIMKNPIALVCYTEQ